MSGGFSFAQDRTAATVSPIELTVAEQKSVNISQWLSLGTLALQAIVLVISSRKS